jgi:hypothetical protein
MPEPRDHFARLERHILEAAYRDQTLPDLRGEPVSDSAAGREAEIEAVAVELRDLISVIANDEKHARAETLIDQLEDAALDVVRGTGSAACTCDHEDSDGRGDVLRCPVHGIGSASGSAVPCPDHPKVTARVRVGGDWQCAHPDHARSPQSEDHEAGMKAMGVLMRDYDRNGGYHPTVKQLADAYRDAARSPQSEDHEECKHPDVRCAEHDGRRAIACFVCGRLFCNLSDDDYAVAYNPRSPQSEDQD